VTATCIILGPPTSSWTGYAVRFASGCSPHRRFGLAWPSSLLLLCWPFPPVAHSQGCTSTPLSRSPRKTTCLWTRRSRSPVHQVWDGHKWVTYLLRCVKCGFSHCATCWLVHCKCSRVWWSIPMHISMVGFGQKNSFSIAFSVHNVYVIAYVLFDQYLWAFFESCSPPYYIDMRSPS
jgi:hypothetical protein